MARGVWDAGLYLVWLDADRYTEEEKHSKYESSHTPGPDGATGGKFKSSGSTSRRTGVELSERSSEPESSDTTLPPAYTEEYREEFASHSTRREEGAYADTPQGREQSGKRESTDETTSEERLDRTEYPSSGSVKTENRRLTERVTETKGDYTPRESSTTTDTRFTSQEWIDEAYFDPTYSYYHQRNAGTPVTIQRPEPPFALVQAPNGGDEPVVSTGDGVVSTSLDVQVDLVENPNGYSPQDYSFTLDIPSPEELRESLRRDSLNQAQLAFEDLQSLAERLADPNLTGVRKIGGEPGLAFDYAADRLEELPSWLAPLTQNTRQQYRALAWLANLTIEITPSYELTYADGSKAVILNGEPSSGTLAGQAMGFAKPLGTRPPKVKSTAAPSGINARLAAGAADDVNGLTKAGRALEKHGSRPGSNFPKATGNVAAKNAQGQQVLDDLLRSNNQRIQPNRFGGQDIFDINTGRGVRFDANGNMMGFLEL